MNKSSSKDKLKLKLGLYLVFILFICLLVLLFGKNDRLVVTNDNDRAIDTDVNTEVDATTKISYYDKQEKLLTEDYSYTFKIMAGKEIIYKGECKGQVRTGYKESDRGIIKYENNNNQITILLREDDNFYENLNAAFFDFKNLFASLNQESALIDKRDEYTIYYYENIDDYTFLVTTSKEAITEITIQNATTTYELAFTY